MPTATHRELTETIKQTVDLFKSDIKPTPVTNDLPTAKLIPLPEGWGDEYAGQRVVAISVKIWGTDWTVLATGEEILHFVNKARSLRMRSRATMSFMNTYADDVSGWVTLKRTANGCILTFEFDRVQTAAEDILGEQASRDFRLSEMQMSNVLADLEMLAGLAQDKTEEAEAA